MKRIMNITITIGIIATIFCRFSIANVATMHLKADASELSGTLNVGEKDNPAVGAKIQLCEKGWNNCTITVSTDSNGKFKFEGVKVKHVNYVLINWPGANLVKLELVIKKGAKPLVIGLHPE
jgi:riboflavin synthase